MARAARPCSAAGSGRSHSLGVFPRCLRQSLRSLLPLLGAATGWQSAAQSGGQQASAAREEVLSIRPLVVAVRNWATPEECQRVLDLISRCHSGDWKDCKEVASALHSKSNSTVGGHPRRKSHSFQLGLHGELDEAVDGLVRRAHLFARHPITYGEGVQIASYGPGEYYEFHHDSLSRRATLLLYLTDIPEGDGGETVFPMVRAPGVAEDAPAPLPPAVAGHTRKGLDFKIEKFEPMAPYCASDFYLKVRPEAGKAILFYNYAPNYQMDEYAVHGSCPIRRGRKAILQRWMRFEENSLFAREAEADEALRRGRTEWGLERAIRPQTPSPEEAASTPAPPPPSLAEPPPLAEPPRAEM